MKDKLLIIMPVYNEEETIGPLIDQLRAEEIDKIADILIINDGSKDRSGEINEYYAGKDPRIRLIHQKNQGLSMARNRGIELASADYITFVDSDDALHPETLAILYQELIKEDADISVGDYESFYGDQFLENFSPIRRNKEKILTNIQAVNTILEDSETKMIVAWGKLYKKSLFKAISYPKDKYHEDEFVTYRLFYEAGKVVVTDAKLYRYRQREESITGEKYSIKRLDKLLGLKEAIYFFEEKKEDDISFKARLRYLLNLQIAYYRVSDEMKQEKKLLRKLKKEYDDHYLLVKKAKGSLPFLYFISLPFFIGYREFISELLVYSCI